MAFNEMTPGMNTQAKKPAFEPKGDVMPMQPMQPQGVPQQPEFKTIKEYLAAVKAMNQVPYFTNIPGNQGPGGMDPNTGQPIAPAMQFGDIGNRGQIVPPNQPNPAIPEPGGDPADKRIVGDDPYDMAKQRLEHLLPEIWKQMFPDKEPGGELPPEDYDRWMGAVTHMNNELIKKYENKIKDTRKRGESLIKDHTPKSVQKYLDSGNLEDLEKRIDWVKIEGGMREKLEKEYDKLGTYGVEETGQDRDTYVDTRVNARIKAMQDSIKMRRDKAAGGNQGQAGGGPGNIPPELQSDYEKATAQYKQMASASHGVTGQPLSHEKILEILAEEYPKLKRFF